MRRPLTVFLVLALGTTGIGIASVSAATHPEAPATVSQRALHVSPGSAIAAADVTETLVESIDLAELDTDGLAEPDVETPAEHQEPVASPTDAVGHDHVGTPEDIAVAGTSEADAAEAVVVGLTRRLELPAGQVNTLGVTWEDVHEDVHVDVRTVVGDEWGVWTPLAVEPTEESDGSGREGTGPFVMTEAQEVQVRVLTADGEQPADLQLTLISVGAAPTPVVDDGSAVVAQTAKTGVAQVDADVEAQTRAAMHFEPTAAASRAAPAAVAGWTPVADGSPTPDGPMSVDLTSVGMAPAPSAATAPVRAPGGITASRPAIHLRSEWGAAPFIGTPEPADVRAAVVHHTVSSNTYTAAQVPAMLRSIQAYHVQGRKWSDIGYNFLVDRFGRIWEGRQGGVDKEIRGVHASEANSLSTGISVIGNLDIAVPPPAVTTAVARLIAWKLALHDVAVGERFVLAGRTFSNVIGHRDVPSAATACPGRHLYPKLAGIQAQAAALQSFKPVDHTRSMTGPGSLDLLVTGSKTSVVPIAPAPVHSRAKIGNGWKVMDLVVTAKAFRGGASMDLLAREKSTGRLYIYHGDGRGSFSGRTALGFGWGAMSHILAPGDFNGDGHQDIIAVEESTGLLWFYPGNGRLQFGPRQRIGNGWGGILGVTTGQDLTGDGHVDVVGIMGDGRVNLYPGNGRGSFLTRRTIATGLTGVDSVILPGDMTYDGIADIVLRDGPSGRMVTLSLNRSGGVKARSWWGNGWGEMYMVISGRGWSSPTSSAVLAIGPNGDLFNYAAKNTVTLAPAKVSNVNTAVATEVVVAGQVTGSDRADVLTRDTAGRLFLHETSSTGGIGAGRQIGNGWQIFDQIISLGDVDFDGGVDLLAKHRDGRLFVYPFTPGGDGRFEAPYQVGRGFAGYTLVAAPSWDTDAGTIVLAINDRTGELRRFAARGRAMLSDGRTIGSGWAAFTDLVALDDPIGNGTPGLLARHVTGTTWLYLGDGRGGFGGRLTVSASSIPRSADIK